MVEEVSIAYAEYFVKICKPVHCDELCIGIAALEAAGYTPLEIN